MPLRPYQIFRASRNRPAVAAAMLITLGILLHSLLPIHPWWWICTSLGTAIAARICWRWTILASLLLALSALLCGTAAAQLDRFFYPAHDISAYLTPQGRLATLEMVIDQPPRIITPSSDRPMPPRMELQGRVVRVLETGGWTDASGLLAVSLPGVDSRLAIGQRLRLIGTLSRPTAPVNPGQVDWSQVNRDAHLLAEMRVNHPDCVTIISDPGAGAVATIRSDANDVLSQGFSPEAADARAMLAELTLGISNSRLSAVRAQCAMLGVRYQLSISGLHMAIIAFFAYWICRLLRVDPKRGRMIALAAALAYGIMATPSAAGTRSLLLAAIATFAVLSDRSVNRVQLLAVAVAALLLWHPDDLYRAGFQISLAAAIGLMVFYRPAIRWLRGPVSKPIPIGRRAKLRWLIAQRATSLVAATLVAWAVTMPLAAFWFGQIAPAGAIVALLLFPLTACTLLAGIGKIFLTLCMPGAATGLAAIAGWPANLLLRSIAMLAAHLGVNDAPRLSVAHIVIYYLLLAAPLVLPASFVRRIAFGSKPSEEFAWPRRTWKPLLPALAIASLLAWPLVQGPASPNPTPGEMRITLLSVGSGQCTIIQPPTGGAWVLDAGSSMDAPIARDTVQPFLDTDGHAHLAGMILNGADSDKISAAADLLRTQSAPVLMFSPDFARRANGDHAVQRVLDVVSEAQGTQRPLTRGDDIALCPGAELHVLSASASGGSSIDCGVILRLTFAGRSVLFASDSQSQIDALLAEHRAELKSDVLLAPNHGAAGSGTGSLLSAVSPVDIVASSEERLSRKQQTFNAQAGSRPLYRTGASGAITIHIRADGKLWITTFRPSTPGAIPELAMQ